MFDRYHIVLGMIAAVCLCSCSHRALEEAQVVVAEADSLWRAGKMYGIDEGDSAALAQAYETLGRFTQFSMVHSQLSTAYVHACYQYGRLLRRSDNPAEAMQVFIYATHTRTRDFHILGRVYSNMGSICHSADEYALAFDMYERSTNLFLQNGDSLLYFYGLNNLAFEKAMLADKKATMSLLDKIENLCTNTDVLSEIYETKAELYLRTQQYDSAIYYVNHSALIENNEPLGLLIKAQAYSYLSEKDSSAYYAKQVLLKSHNLSQINNAQYILTNDDESKGADDIREVAADRADTQKLLEIQYGKNKQAVQLLEQDINKKPDLKWLYSVIITLLIISTIICIILNRKRKQHKLLSQQRSKYTRNRKADIEISYTALHNSKNLKKDLDWDNYDLMCHIVNARLGGLADKLKSNPDITSNDVRLCVLILLNLSYEDIATMLNLSTKSISKLKSITAQKLGVSMKNLRSKLLQIACSED